MVARLARVPREHRRASFAALVAMVVLIASLRVLTAEGDLRDADVVLRAGAGVTVTPPGGVARPAVDGESLPRDAVVTTGPGSTATLDVRDRLVLLAPETTVAVPDGAITDLRRGSVLVDRRKGPGLTLRAGALVLDEIEEGAVRVDRGFSTRVSVYSGGARATTSDRRLGVPRLHQAAVAGRALPDRPTPLRLMGDDWESLVIPAVTAADAELSQIARGIDRDVRLTDSSRVEVLPAVYRGALTELPSGAARSEALLPVAIGLAVDSTRVPRARQLRGEGGSWGVVAALVGARTASVSARLAQLLAEPGEQAAVGAPVAGAPASSDTGVPGSPPVGSPSPSARPSGPRPSGSPAASASPSPSPSSSDVVDTIRELIPSETPSATPVIVLSTRALSSPAPTAPGVATSPPLVTVNTSGIAGVLKALLG